MLTHKRLTLLLEEKLLRISFSGLKNDYPHGYEAVKKLLLHLEWFEFLSTLETSQEAIHDIMDIYKAGNKIVVIPKKKDGKYSREECIEIAEMCNLSFALFEERAALEV